MSKFISGNPSFSVYRVNGTLPDNALELFQKYVACKLEEATDVPNIGWCGRNSLERKINDETAYIGSYLHVLFRKAVRKIPANLLKAECEFRETLAMDEDNISSLSRKRKKEIKEAVVESLMQYMPPQITNVPVLYLEEDNLLFVGTSSLLMADTTVSLLMETLGGIDLIPISPISLAMMHLKTKNLDIEPVEFTREDKYSDGQLLLGRDFLTWIWCKCESENPKFIVPDLGEFAIAIDGPLNLKSDTLGSKETVLRKGLPTLSAEAHYAVKSGKKLTGAKIYIGRGDETWSFNFDADNFIFKSVKLPDGEAMDKVSRLEERAENMALMSNTIMHLYKIFLDEITGDKMNRSALQDWLDNRLYHGSEKFHSLD